jgi:hypothetical protein
MQAGCWFTLANTAGRAVIFSVFTDGVFTPCAAIIGQSGQVETLVPLSRHAQRMMGRISAGILRVYIQRIEESEALLRAAEGGPR